jgi:hypothetical protein
MYNPITELKKKLGYRTHFRNMGLNLTGVRFNSRETVLSINQLGKQVSGNLKEVLNLALEI